MPDASKDLDELDSILQTIESINEDLAVKVAYFITNELYDPNEPETWTLSIQYAKWAMSKDKIARRDDITHDCKTCYKNTGWIVLENGDFRPCDECSRNVADRWQRDFVNSDGPPR